MAGTRSVTFDTETEDIVIDFMEEFHHGKFSQGLRALVKSFTSMQRANQAYMLQNAELTEENEKLKFENKRLEAEVLRLQGELG